MKYFDYYNTVNTQPEFSGSRENTTLPGLYFPENLERGCVFMYEPEGSGLNFLCIFCVLFWIVQYVLVFEFKIHSILIKNIMYFFQKFKTYFRNVRR